MSAVVAELARLLADAYVRLVALRRAEASRSAGSAPPSRKAAR